MSEKEKRYVSWAVFVWAIGFLTFFMFGQTGGSIIAYSKANKAETDIGWIRDDICEIKTDLKTLLNNK